MAVVPTMTPEKKSIYSVFAFLNTHQPSPARTKFTKACIKSIKDLIKVDLRRMVLENSASRHVAPLSDADEILTSLDGVYGDMGEAAGSNHMTDG